MNSGGKQAEYVKPGAGSGSLYQSSYDFDPNIVSDSAHRVGVVNSVESTGALCIYQAVGVGRRVVIDGPVCAGVVERDIVCEPGAFSAEGYRLVGSIWDISMD